MQRCLQAAGMPNRVYGKVLALPTAYQQMPRLRTALDAHLPSPIQDSVQAVFYQGEMECPFSALAAFIDAEPLPVLLARQAHEWVREALDDGWLFSAFHPIIDADTLEIYGHEALIRARNPRTQETIGAGPIIQACEQLELQHVLDQRARQTAIRDAAALGLPEGRFFINFLPNTIYDPEICLRTTMEAAAKHQMDVARLVFEVVETESIPDMKRLKRILDYYRSRGVGTAVDDMGAGFSSTDYLTVLHPDYVKLDRGIVVAAEQDSSARHKMDEIIGTAKALGIRVIAEGIETPAQMQVCRDSGADLVQGFLFARPANPPQTVDPSAFSRRLAA